MTLEELHNLSFKNKDILLSKAKCGCFYCKQIFAPSDITEWIDDGESTALCPHCEIDSVIPDMDNTLNEELLESMYQRYFGK